MEQSRGALWLFAVVGFAVLSWPIARGGDLQFSFQTFLWMFVGWIVLIRLIAHSVRRPWRGPPT